ncbi:MAG TPA: hypothetical protein VNE71_13075 [Myxococcota bacterium]|nr:hypothetical protein [Myxococcota bacterium]
MRDRGRDEIVEVRLPAFVTDPRGVLRRRWLWMLLAGAAVLAAGAVGIRFKFAPQYLAKATVMVSSQQIRENLVPSALTNGAFDKISLMVGETLSSERLGAVIDELDLYPALRPILPREEIVGILRSKVSIEAMPSVGPQPTFETAGVFTVAVRYDRPDLAAAAANALATTFAESGVRLRLRQTQLATELLRERERVHAKALADQEAEVERFQAVNRGALAGGNNDQLEEQLALLRARLAGEQANYTEEHPNIRALRRQLGGLSGQLGDIHEKKDELKALERRATIARRVHQEALARVQEAELSERLEESEGEGVAAVLDRAVPPTRPVRTRLQLVILVALASLGAAGLVGAFLELRDPVIVNPDQLGARFDLTVLGGVPAIR